MGREYEKQSGLSVAVTGATGDLGALLMPLLERDPAVGRILAIDLAKPRALGPKVEFRRVDLAHPGGEGDLQGVLEEAKVEVLYHLAFLSGRVHDASLAHELEVIGSMHVLASAGAAGVRRLIFPSLTALYGARAQAPALLTEETPLFGCPGSRFISDKVEVEQQLEVFRQSHPQTRVIILRFAPIVGPTVDNPLTRWLKTRIVPTLLGFDPLWQVVHEDDAAAALHLALSTEAQGVFNVAAPGRLTLSGLVRGAGGWAIPLPRPLARAAISLLEAVGASSVPAPLLDFLTYSWVADEHRAEEELGFVPRYESKEAIASLRRS